MPRFRATLFSVSFASRFRRAAPSALRHHVQAFSSGDESPEYRPLQRRAPQRSKAAESPLGTCPGISALQSNESVLPLRGRNSDNLMRNVPLAISRSSYNNRLFALLRLSAQPVHLFLISRSHLITPNRHVIVLSIPYFYDFVDQIKLDE